MAHIVFIERGWKIVTYSTELHAYVTTLEYANAIWTSISNNTQTYSFCLCKTLIIYITINQNIKVGQYFVICSEYNFNQILHDPQVPHCVHFHLCFNYTKGWFVGKFIIVAMLMLAGLCYNVQKILLIVHA